MMTGIESLVITSTVAAPLVPVEPGMAVLAILLAFGISAITLGLAKYPPSSLLRRIDHPGRA